MDTRDETIASELSGDPLGRTYSGLSDEAARDDMNSEYRINDQGVWLSDAFQYLSHRNNDPGTGSAWPCLVMLRELAEDGTVQAVAATPDDKVAAENLMGFFSKASDAGGQLIYMDFSQAAISLSWDAMVNVGVVKQSQRDELETLSNVPQSRGVELEVGSLTTTDITRNRP